AFTLIAGELFRGKSHTDPLRLEHLVVSHFTIGLHLLLIFVSNLRMHALRQRLGRFPGRNPNRFAGFGVDKSSRHLAPVAEFKARFPSRQPVTTITASVAQRSISTKVTIRFRSLPSGSFSPSIFRPNMAIRTPST